MSQVNGYDHGAFVHIDGSPAKDLKSVRTKNNTPKEPVMSDEKKNESADVNETLTTLSEKMKDIAMSKTTHVIVGNALTGGVAGAIGGLFGPVGAMLTIGSYALGHLSSSVSFLYQKKELLDECYDEGVRDGIRLVEDKLNSK